MIFKCTFLNNIHGIEFNTEELLLSEELQIRMSNDEKFLKDFFTQETISIVGAGNSVASLRMKTYLYVVFTVPKDLFKEEQLLPYLLKCSSILSNALWLIKDNSVRFNIGHLKYTDDITLTVHSNFIDSLYTNHIGIKNITKFSKVEIIDAIKYFGFFFMIYSNSKNEEDTHAEVDRITRAFYFVDLARKNTNIGMKVSLHCSAFECLFSVSASELIHRLSETIANFLGTDYSSRKDLYHKMKDIYALRSSVTHGSGISSKLVKNNAEKLNAIGNNCDDIMRRCLLKIIGDESLKQLYRENKTESITEYLTDLNFKDN